MDGAEILPAQLILRNFKFLGKLCWLNWTMLKVLNKLQIFSFPDLYFHFMRRHMYRTIHGSKDNNNLHLKSYGGLTNSWKTDSNVVMNTFARRKIINDKYGIFDKNKAVTHCSMNPPRKFHVPKDDNDVFLRQYTEAVYRGMYATILELPTEFSPVRFDIDVKKLTATDEKVLSDDFVEEILKMYCKCMLKYLDSTFNAEKDFNAFILKREKKSWEGHFKEGIHAVFPNVVFPTWLHNPLLHLPVAKMVKKTVNFDEKVEIVVDPVGNGPWFLLESRKHYDLYPYRVTQTWQYGEKLKPHSLEWTSIDELFKWVKKFSIRHKSCSVMKKKSMEEWKQEVQVIKDENSSRISSSVYSQSDNNYKRKTNNNDHTDKTFNLAMIDFYQIRSLVEILNHEVSDNFRSWASIRFALKVLCSYLDEDEDLFFNLWAQFSKKSLKYDAIETKKTWDMEKADTSDDKVVIAIKILLKYANQVDKQEVNKIMSCAD